MDPGVAAGPTQLDRLTLPRAKDGAHALNYHQCTNNTEEDDVRNTDGDVELADGAQRCEQPHAESRADYAAREQHEGEGEIDSPALPITDSPGHGRSGYMSVYYCYGDRRRD